LEIKGHDTDNNFTILRLVLALLVVLGHFHLLAGVTSPPWPFNYAAVAVDCFFVVSGYLVANSFDRDSDFKRFYIRRFFRIYPLYIVVVALQTLILGLLEPAGFMANLGSLARYFAVNAVFANFLQYDVGAGVLTGLANPSLNASLWTLKIEVGFYLLLPFLWLAVRRFGVGVLVGTFVLSVIYDEALMRTGYEFLAKQLPGQLQFFVLGMAAYWYRDVLEVRRRVSPIVGLIGLIVLTTALTAMLAQRPPVLYPLLVGAVVMIAALKTPVFNMRNDISYGVYLVHAPLIQLALLFGIYRADWAGLAAIVSLTVLLALLAERFIEIPGIAAGKRLIARDRAKALPGAAGSMQSDADTLTVVVLNDFCYVQGGASKVAIEEAISLSQAGAKVIFVGAVGPASENLRAASLTHICLEQHELLDAGKHPGVVLQGLWNRKAATRVGEVLRGLPRDSTIVHIHGYTKALTTSPVKIAGDLGFKVICTLHDFFAACPNGAFFDYRKNVPCTKRALSVSCVATNCDKRHYAHKLFRVLRRLIQSKGAAFPGSVRHYISLSKRSAAVLTPYLPAQAQLYPLENSIDWARPAPVSVATNKTILFVGRLDPEKGAGLLAKAAERLGLGVTFVGDGPLRQELEAVSAMSVTGWKAREDVRRWIASARCLVFPSLWYETYGLVVAEAAAYGVPVIVSDVTAAAERVEDGRTGWLFRSGDADDLVRCLALLGDDDRVQSAGTAAYDAFWSGARDHASHAAALIAIYRSILRG